MMMHPADSPPSGQATNAFSSLQIDDIAAIKANLQRTKTEAPKPVEKLVNLPSTIKAMEQEEPLLKENKHRFVLFPIKYHEVCGIPQPA